MVVDNQYFYSRNILLLSMCIDLDSSTKGSLELSIFVKRTFDLVIHCVPLISAKSYRSSSRRGAGRKTPRHAFICTRYLISSCYGIFLLDFDVTSCYFTGNIQIFTGHDGIRQGRGQMHTEG